MTYFRRIYHPFLLGQPSMHTTAAGSLMLWTHRAPHCSQRPAEHAVHAVLGAAVIIPSLAGLAEAVSAVEGLIHKQGLLLLKLPHCLVISTMQVYRDMASFTTCAL